MNKGKLTISRPSFGSDKEVISISVIDKDAVVEFLEIEIGLDEFARCITGLSNIECNFETRHLEVVGKKRERETIQFKISNDYVCSDKKSLAIEKAKKYTPEGWIADTYYGSQSSFFTKNLDGNVSEYWAKTSIIRWIDK